MRPVLFESSSFRNRAFSESWQKDFPLQNSGEPRGISHKYENSALKFQWFGHRFQTGYCRVLFLY